MDTIIDLAKKAKSAELNSRILELQEALIQVSTQLSTEQERRERLEVRVRDLESQRVLGQNLVLRDGMYWTNEASTECGPYCQRCFVEKERLFALKPLIAGEMFDCPLCQNRYTTELHRTRLQQQSARQAEALRARSREHEDWVWGGR